MPPHIPIAAWRRACRIAESMESCHDEPCGPTIITFTRRLSWWQRILGVFQ